MAFLTILSGLLALLCLVLLGLALAEHPAAITDPVQMLSIPGVNMTLVRGSMLADMLGYYLLLLPLIYYLRPYLRKQTLYADLISAAGLVYVLVGAIGAAVMAEVAPRLYADYYASAPGIQDQIQVVYQTIVYLVYNGLWNLLGSLVAGTWWLLMGYSLTHFHKTTGMVSMILGTFTVMDPIGNLLGLGWLAEIGLNGYLVLAPVWAIYLGVVVFRKPFVFAPSPALPQVA